MENVVTFAHNIIKNHITSDSFVIDATVGNGFDTVFLAKHAKHVFGFDIQQEAINITKDRLTKEHLQNVTLFCHSHEFISSYITEPIDAVIYNLGYLPNGDKSITTSPSTTIASIESVLSLLSKKGIITVTIYIGHEEGKREQKILEDYFKLLDSSIYTVIRYQHINKDTAPYTVCLQKK